MIDRSQSVANTLSPPIAKPLIRAITGFGISRMIDWSLSIGSPIIPRPLYWPSLALWSPPVQQALSAAHGRTTDESTLSSAACVNEIGRAHDRTQATNAAH